ncbi:MAG: right-handed parallel beta-helix repeat-containing protein [Chitinispirillaceae bacterium]|nr:right-handed parallel beta-helix repeat-containing protein [Chitinispirillaceae bacterium]
MIRFCLALLCLCFSAVSSATYYVDYTDGSNTGSGTSRTAAWKHCPGDASATGVPKSKTVLSGDTIIFKGGAVYKGLISLTSSGTSQSPIVYDGNSAGSWGTGKAVIDGENLRSYGFSGTFGTISHITIRNFEVRNIKYTGIEWEGGAAIKIDDASFVTIADCYCHDVGYWKNDGSIVPAGSGVHMLRPRYCLVTGCEITRTGLAGIQVNGSVNCIFSRNDIHDYVTWGIDIGGDFNLATGNVVCDNTIHDMYQYDAGYYGGAGDPPHTDYVFIRKGSGQRPVNNIIERNLFYNNQTFKEFGGTALVFLSYADSTIMRNNVFINGHGYYATRFAWSSTGTKFYNNTIYAPRAFTGGGGGGVFLETNGKSDIRNNIIVTYQSSIAYTSADDEKGLICDNNLFYNVTSSQDFVRISPARYTPFAQWKALGFDTHSIHIGAISDIGFVKTDGYPTACETMNLALKATSPAIGTGATLKGFSDDKNSSARFATKAWDLGAYAYTGNMIPTAVRQPSTLTAEIKSDFSLSVIRTNSSSLRIDFASPASSGILRFDICNLSGKSIATATHELSRAKNSSVKVNSPLPAGIYLCRVQGPGINKTARFTVSGAR